MTTRPSVSGERAELLTRFERENASVKESTPVHRARGFRYLLEHETLYHRRRRVDRRREGAASTRDVDVPRVVLPLTRRSTRPPDAHEDAVRRRRRDARPLRVDDHSVLEGKEPARTGVRGDVPEWHAAFDAGVFTEFMEQRAPGHAILDDKIYRPWLARLQGTDRGVKGAVSGLRRSGPRGARRRARCDGDRVRRAHPTRRALRRTCPAHGRPRRRPRDAAPSCSRSPTSARGCRPTPRGRSARRCRCTGSSTSAWSPS